jgi:formylglycine-generating enzyme required for sulfatase activity
MQNWKRFGAFWALLLLMVVAFIGWRIVVRRPQPRTKVNSHDGLTYVWIRPGTFQMGCSPNDSECADDEKPAHSVTITRGFWIGQTPVTQAAYKKGVGNPSSFPGDRLPVEQVSWNNARAYCEALEMRLPTEAEWEYAARGGSRDARYAPLDQIAWYSANSNNQTHEVAQKQANAYGLYDMLGNVREWVADSSGPYDSASTVDPKGPPEGDPRAARVLRGGSWTDAATYVRVSSRDRSAPTEHDFAGGFRCAGN